MTSHNALLYPKGGREWALVLLCTSCTFTMLSGCEQQDEASQDGTGIRAQALIDFNNTDVTLMRYTVQPVDCATGDDAGDPLTFDADLQTGVLPGGIEELEDNPFDAGSQHFFADLFETFPAGCYDLSALPLAEDGTPSEDCEVASQAGIIVNEGTVTEIILLNQCFGEDPGGVDVIGVLNREPILESVVFPSSKFACVSEPNTVCAYGSDPDADPIELELVLGSQDCTATSTAPDPQDPQPLEQCWEVTCDATGRADMAVFVYDMIWVNGALVRVEDYLSATGNPVPSHATLAFFMYNDDCGGGEGGAGGDGGETSTGGAATGGVTQTGGVEEIGGTQATGGETSTGGVATGGVQTTGGIGETGGTLATGGSTGSSGAGGASSGGVAATGGTTSTGGAGGVGGAGEDLVEVRILYHASEGPFGPTNDLIYPGGNDVTVWSYYQNGEGVESDGTICHPYNDTDPTHTTKDIDADLMWVDCTVQLPASSPYWLFDVFMPWDVMPASTGGNLTWGNFGNRACEPWGGGDGDPTTGEPNGELTVYVDGELVAVIPNPNWSFVDPDPSTACEPGEALNYNALVYNPLL